MASTVDAADYIEQLVLTSTYSLLYVVGVPLFIWRSSREPIRSRCWALATFQATYCLFDMCISASQNLPPCFPRQLDTVWTMLLWIYPFFIRL